MSDFYYDDNNLDQKPERPRHLSILKKVGKTLLILGALMFISGIIMFMVGIATFSFETFQLNIIAIPIISFGSFIFFAGLVCNAISNRANFSSRAFRSTRYDQASTEDDMSTSDFAASAIGKAVRAIKNGLSDLNDNH